MYINFKILKTRDLTIKDIVLVQIAKQCRSEDLSEVFETEYATSWSIVDSLVERGYLTIIKGKKNNTLYQKIRATKKGTDLLSDIETPEVNEEDLTIFEWMSKLYKSKGKELGNMKRTKRHIAAFRVQSGIEKNNLAKLLQEFVSDDSNMEYNHILEYAFFKPSNQFDVRFDLAQSRLYKYYLERETHFRKMFENFE